MNLIEETNKKALKQAQDKATYSQIGGGPAFPQSERIGDVAMSFGGMSLRDYFAGEALNSILAQEDGGIQACAPSYMAEVDPVVTAAEIWAKNAYEIADAMIKERAK